MDSNPEFLEAVRARLLTREVLDMPATLQQLSWTLREFMDATNKRLDGLETRLDTLEVSQNELRETLNAFMDSTDKRFAAAADERREMRDEMADIKGMLAEHLFNRRAGFVPGEMGYTMEGMLAPAEVMNILNNADTSDAALGDLDSFKRADSILCATDSDGSEHYIYIEVSYTIYPRDIRRAVDHARRLTDWSGIPSHPAVAGVRVNWRAKEAIENGEAHYHRIPESMLTRNR